MIVVTENRKIKISSSMAHISENGYLVFKNTYGVIRLKVKEDKIVAYGNGLDNPVDDIEVLE